MRFILLLLIITSCNPDNRPNSNLIKETIQNQGSFDNELWEVKKLFFKEMQEDIFYGDNQERHCFKYKVNYNIELKDTCFINKKESFSDNYFINKLKEYTIREQPLDFYEPGGCLTQNKINNYINNLKIQVQSKLNTTYCQKRNHALFGGECIKEKTVTQEDIDNFIKNEKKLKMNKLNKGKLVKKGHTKKMTSTLSLCQDWTKTLFLYSLKKDWYIN